MSKKQILIEGPDCSGKSTLVERLKNRLHWDSKTLHHREGNQFQRYLFEYATNQYVIFDRGHVSEMVYGILWRHGNSISDLEQLALDAIVKRNMHVIFACPSVEKMKERYKARTFAQQISYEELETSHKLFVNLMAGIPHSIYCSNDEKELDYAVESIAGLVQ